MTDINPAPLLEELVEQQKRFDAFVVQSRNSLLAARGAAEDARLSKEGARMAFLSARARGGGEPGRSARAFRAKKNSNCDARTRAPGSPQWRTTRVCAEHDEERGSKPPPPPQYLTSFHPS